MFKNINSRTAQNIKLGHNNFINLKLKLMSFTGHENHSINLTDASTLTENYRNNMSVGDTIGHYFGRDAIEAILAQSDCVVIRIYYGLDADSKKQLVVVGVLANENDIYTGLLAEQSYKSPPYTGANNSLNS